MTTKNKFTIILTVMLLTVISFKPLQIKASTLPTALETVPWTENDNYIIGQKNDGTWFALVSSNQDTIFKSNGSLIGMSGISNHTKMYLTANNTSWYYSNTAQSAQFNLDGVSYYYRSIAGYTPTHNTLRYNTKSITGLSGSILFPNRSFLTLTMLRERAMNQAVQEMMTTTVSTSGTILPVGLAVLSMLLVVGLIIWLKRFLT